MEEIDMSELERELRLKYSMHRKSLSDPFELLDLVPECLVNKNRVKAIELAEEIYFGYALELYEYNKED